MEMKNKVIRIGATIFFAVAIILHAFAIYFGSLCLSGMLSNVGTGEDALNMTFGLIYYLLFCGLGLISSFVSFVLFRVGPNKEITYCKVLNIIQAIVDIISVMIFIIVLTYTYILK